MKSLILRGYRPALVVLGLLLAAVAQAAVPSALTADGVLTSQGGGPVADGNYAVTFVIYKDAAGGAPVWSEGPLQVAVKNGAFSQVLGAVKPVDALVAAAGGWITLAVGNDPELARKPWRSVPFALRAQVAEGLECSGCIKAGMLDPQTVPAVAKSGAYSDLSGLPTLAKLGTTCGSGLVVKGLMADGSLDCVAGLVGGKCAAGQVVTEVKADGSVVCGTVGITGGACQAGQVVTAIAPDGKPTCADPAIGPSMKQAINAYFSSMECRRKQVLVSPSTPIVSGTGYSGDTAVDACAPGGLLLGFSQYDKNYPQDDRYIVSVHAPSDSIAFAGSGGISCPLSTPGGANARVASVAGKTATFQFSYSMCTQGCKPSWQGTCTAEVVCCEPTGP